MPLQLWTNVCLLTRRCVYLGMLAAGTNVTSGNAGAQTLPTVAITGAEQIVSGVADQGTVTLTLNGISKSVVYGTFSSAESVASGLAAAFTADCTSPAKAHATGRTISFASRNGSSFGTPVYSTAFDSAHFNQPSFGNTGAEGGAGMVLSCIPEILTPGSALTCSAIVSAGSTGPVSFYLDGNSIGVSTINVKGSANISLKPSLANGAHTVTSSYGGDHTHAGSSSLFEISSEAAVVLPTDGSGSQIYSYSIAKTDNTSGYSPIGNITDYTDSINGRWHAAYDPLNRLIAATQTQVGSRPDLYFNSSSQNFCWTYDSFGNRTLQALSDQPFSSNCQATASANLTTTVSTFNTSNQVSSSSVAPYGYSLDAAGNVLEDGANQYLYDGDGHLCASWNKVLGQLTGYLYDAEGTRTAKGSLTSFSCDIAGNGFTMTNEYITGPSGQPLTELDGSGRMLHTNAYAGGDLVATYNTTGLHFNLNDWLGSRRVQTDYTGAPELVCSGGSFGDLLNCTGTADDATNTTQIHFTGKERDTESGLDYFGARYYGSSMGRFMSPDDGEDQHTDNPQSWNLYSYGRNNPLIGMDDDGHTYNVCPPGVSPGSSQCTNIDDKTFEAEQKQDQANGVNFAHGTISDSNGVQGTYTHDPDIAGDPARNIAAMGQIGNQGMGAIKAFTVGSIAVGGTLGLAGVPTMLLGGAEIAPLVTEEATVLARAGSAVGNQGAKVASREVAEEIGKKFVGEGAQPIYSRTGEIVGEKSADGLKIVRWTSIDKAEPYINMVNKLTGGNLHVGW